MNQSSRIALLYVSWALLWAIVVIAAVSLRVSL